MCPATQLTGIHSRSEELVELTRSYDRGRVSWARVEDKLAEETSRLIKLQQNLGFEYVSDGALEWRDALRPLAWALTGLESETRYSRWFDTNTFYRKPIVNRRVKLGKINVDDFLKTRLLPEDGKWKVTLPGPYTLSELSENQYYKERSEFVHDVAEAEREVVKRLIQGGVSLIQISEPCLVYRPYREASLDDDELELALGAIRNVVNGAGSSFLIQTFFGDASPILERILELPVGAVGFDLFETDFQELKFTTDANIVLGVVDSRESHLEDLHWIVKTVIAISKQIESPKISLAPNSDLKFLPKVVADKKIETLAESARIVEAS